MQFERQTEPIEVSVVMPCLNEEDTLARSLRRLGELSENITSPVKL